MLRLAYVCSLLLHAPVVDMHLSFLLLLFAEIVSGAGQSASVDGQTRVSPQRLGRVLRSSGAPNIVSGRCDPSLALPISALKCFASFPVS